MRRVDQVVEVFKALGGAARLPDVYEYFEFMSDEPLPITWQEGIRGRIYEHSSDAGGDLKEDLFQRIEEGFWKLRDAEIDPDFVRDRQDLSPQEVVRQVVVHEHMRRVASTRRQTGDPLFHMISGGPLPVAPFSHAVETDGWVILTGQMPTDPADPDGPLPDGIVAQTNAVMRNLEIVLQGVRLDLRHVVQCRCYLTEFERDYAAFNETYQSYFPADRRPARTTVGVTALAVGALVEIDMMARRP